MRTGLKAILYYSPLVLLLHSRDLVIQLYATTIAASVTLTLMNDESKEEDTFLYAHHVAVIARTLYDMWLAVYVRDPLLIVMVVVLNTLVVAMTGHLGPSSWDYTLATAVKDGIATYLLVMAVEHVQGDQRLLLEKNV